MADPQLHQVANLLLENSYTTRQLAATAFGVIAILGAFGNGLSLLVLEPLTSSRRHVHTIFITGLCIADLIFCLTSVPWEVSRFSHGRWLFDQGALCSLLGFAKFYNFGVSLLFLALISVNRFVLIVLTPWYHHIYQRRYALVQIGGVCAYAFIMLLPTLAGVWGRFGFEPYTQNCAILSVNGSSPVGVLFLVAFIVPCSTIVVCYAGIAIAVIRSSRRLQRHAQNGRRLEPHRQHEHQFPGLHPAHRDRTWKLTARDYRVVKVGMVVFLAFLVLCLPNTVYLLVDFEQDMPALELVAFIMMYATACVNPVIYVVMDRHYRRACRSVFCGETICTQNGRLVKRSNLDETETDGHRDGGGTSIGLDGRPQSSK